MSRRNPSKPIWAELKKREALNGRKWPPEEQRGPRAYFYGRVSHEQSSDRRDDPSGDTCQSIDHQWELARRRFEYDQSAGKLPEGTTWGTVGWVGTKNKGHDTEDGRYIDQEVSGFSNEWKVRPAGRRAYQEIRPGDSLYIAFVDRGFRNWKDFAAMLQYWNDKGIRVVFIEPELDLGTWTGEMLAGFLGLLAWVQSKLMSVKFREQSNHRRLNGRAYSRFAPRGWKKVNVAGIKRFIPDDELRELALWVVEQRDAGRKWTEIADELEWKVAKVENRPPYPDYPKKGWEGRRWPEKKLRKMYNESKAGAMPLPSRLLPPGTKDVPPPPKRKKR